jgi:SAM-dependent methyltransferase
MTERYGGGGGVEVNAEQRAEVVFRDRTAAEYVRLVEQRGSYWWYAVREFVLRQMGLERGGWLYDAGCGVGLYTLPIVERFPGVRVFAVDFSAASLEVLHQAAQERGVEGRIVRVCADITGWRAPQPVRWVLCTEVLQHIPTEELRLRALRCFWESLEPGGELWLLVARHTLRHRWRGIPREIDEREQGGYFRMRFTVREVCGLVRRAGFAVVRVFGAPVPPVRVGMWVPRRLWGLAHLFQRLPGSAWVGQVVLVRASRW